MGAYKCRLLGSIGTTLGAFMLVATSLFSAEQLSTGESLVAAIGGGALSGGLFLLSSGSSEARTGETHRASELAILERAALAEFNATSQQPIVPTPEPF